MPNGASEGSLESSPGQGVTEQSDSAPGRESPELPPIGLRGHSLDKGKGKVRSEDGNCGPAFDDSNGGTSQSASVSAGPAYRGVVSQRGEPDIEVQSAPSGNVGGATDEAVAAPPCPRDAELVGHSEERQTGTDMAGMAGMPASPSSASSPVQGCRGTADEEQGSGNDTSLCAPTAGPGGVTDSTRNPVPAPPKSRAESPLAVGSASMDLTTAAAAAARLIASATATLRNSHIAAGGEVEDVSAANGAFTGQFADADLERQADNAPGARRKRTTWTTCKRVCRLTRRRNAVNAVCCLSNILVQVMCLPVWFMVNAAAHCLFWPFMLTAAVFTFAATYFTLLVSCFAMVCLLSVWFNFVSHIIAGNPRAAEHFILWKMMPAFPRAPNEVQVQVQNRGFILGLLHRSL